VRGELRVVCGPMFAGKTLFVIGALDSFKKAGFSVQAFKASLDVSRYQTQNLVAHSGVEFPAIAIPPNDPWQIAFNLEPETQIVGIGEAQFFSEELVRVVEWILEKGMLVIVEGLDTDFRGEPFGPMPHLIAIAQEVIKLKGVCRICGAPATRTQRLIDGKPAPYDSPLLMVGGNELYEPRCLKHHEVPGKPIPGPYCPRRED